ncbi:hypothetical protein [Nocardia sp. XZ_19_231]|uniref:hypothetical protein n=1 Tax=Nocardia sp. XZ_19_231 TaxID=2769252 RepID=UPI00188F23E1|nr:hypothetical protein [Nocardia sp. XZ_19_231]
MGHIFADDYAVDRDVDVAAAAAALDRARGYHRPIAEALARVTRQAIAVCRARSLSVRATASALAVSKSEVGRVVKQLERGDGDALGIRPNEGRRTAELVTAAWTPGSSDGEIPEAVSAPVEDGEPVSGLGDPAPVDYLLYIAVDDDHDPVSLEVRAPGPVPRVGETLKFYGAGPNDDLAAKVISVEHQFEARPHCGLRIMVQARASEAHDRDVVARLGVDQTQRAWVEQFDPLLHSET